MWFPRGEMSKPMQDVQRLVRRLVLPSATGWSRHCVSGAVAILGACVSVGTLPYANASPNVGTRPSEMDVLTDFRHLAQMRPRQCSITEQSAPLGWKAAQALCAWQGRLTVRTWTAAIDGAPCVGPAAYWWRWAQERYDGAAFPSAVWYGSWPAQAVASEVGGTKYLATIARTAEGVWMAREWRWEPSERIPTRHWQQSRWDLLLSQSATLRHQAPLSASDPHSRALLAAWSQNASGAPAEVLPDQWRWLSEGRCLTVDAVGVSEGSFQLPNHVEDSRLEQRSAMQLLLARRHPGAIWLRSFSLVESARQSRSRLARFKAVWREQDVVRGQLWIPTKEGGPVLRLRVSVPIGIHIGSGGETVAAAAQAVERALEKMSQLVGNIDG